MRESLLALIYFVILSTAVINLWLSPLRTLLGKVWSTVFRAALAQAPRGWRARAHSTTRRMLIYAERFNREATFVRKPRRRFSTRWGFMEGWWKTPLRIAATAVFTIWLALQIYNALQSAQLATERLAQQASEAIVHERLGAALRDRDQLAWELCVEASTAAAVNGLLTAPFEGLPDSFKAIGRSVVMHFGQQGRGRAELEDAIRAKAARCEPLLSGRSRAGAAP